MIYIIGQGNEKETDVVYLLHKGGEAYGRFVSDFNNIPIILFISCTNYHYVCLDYSFSCSY